MRSMIFVATLAFVATSLGADPEKPLTLKEDEFAVLADERSPDRATVIERYDGKIVKFTGWVRAIANSPGELRPFYNIVVPSKTPKARGLTLRVEWSKDPSVEKTKTEVHKKYESPSGSLEATLYGRFDGKTMQLLDAATDPKIGGRPAKSKEDPPARLKENQKK